VRVALTRSSEDAAATATRLAALGFSPVFAPALAIRPTGIAQPAGAFDALIATSAAAFTALPAERYAPLASLPLYVVGERTAESAVAIGLEKPRAVAPGAAILAALVCDRLRQNARVLHIAGRDRTPGLEEALIAAGHRLVVWEVYEATAREAWSAAEAQAFSEADAALFYSRRSAELAVVLAERAGLREHFQRMLSVCISENAAEPLHGAGAKNIAIAAQPTEAGLLETLKQRARAP
jgi:uroporphyrinogen-III synthase